MDTVVYYFEGGSWLACKVLQVGWAQHLQRLHVYARLAGFWLRLVLAPCARQTDHCGLTTQFGSVRSAQEKREQHEDAVSSIKTSGSA